VQSLQQTRPCLLDLFDEHMPAMPMLFAILEGRGSGEILVDDPDRPTQCIVRDGAWWGSPVIPRLGILPQRILL
jgi:hypothetical protein